MRYLKSPSKMLSAQRILAWIIKHAVWCLDLFYFFIIPSSNFFLRSSTISVVSLKR